MDDQYVVLEIVGTVAFAVSGAAVALRARMDWLGVAVLAVVTSVGGGTIRDVLIGRVPVSWVLEPWPVWLAAASAGLVIGEAYVHPRKAPDSRRIVLVADALGLAAFTAAGTVVSLNAGVSAPVAILLGAVTGTGGGVLRDVLARQRPLILIGQIYALTALAGAVALVLLRRAEVPAEAAQWSAIAVTFVLRLLAMRYSWSLPHNPSYRAEPPPTASPAAE